MIASPPYMPMKVTLRFPYFLPPGGAPEENLWYPRDR